MGARLPEEIMLNILSRLPFESVLRCRRVCKTWRSLPILGDNTYFADMHLRHHLRQFSNHECHQNNFNADTKMSFVFLGANGSLYYAEYDENNEQSYRTHKRMSLPLPSDTWSMVGSCNGLICLSVQLSLFTYDPVYICNPITREFLHLPGFILNDEHKHIRIAQGFGYHPSTNEYKVVRIYYHEQSSVGQVQVYALGSGTGWRTKREVTHRLLATSPGILLNGALHWFSREGDIVAFDLADEEFRCLPTPPCSTPNWNTQSNIWVLAGWLCIVIESSYLNAESADIWLLMKNEKQNTSSDDVTKEQVYQSGSWSREFSININRIGTKNQPLAITKNGEILLLPGGKTIVCCDPKTTAKPKTLVVLDEGIDGNHAISHFNSFVSLKALGEHVETL